MKRVSERRREWLKKKASRSPELVDPAARNRCGGAGARRAKAESARFAVVVRFSRDRDRYERRGLRVEGPALEETEREVAEG